MKNLNIIVYFCFFIPTNCGFAQNYIQKNNIIILTGVSKIMKGNKYVELNISLDNSEIIGYIRYDGNNVFFLGLEYEKEKLLLSLNNQKKRCFDTLNNFGNFRTIKLCKNKGKNTYNALILSPKLSHVELLKTVKTIIKSKEELVLEFYYTNPFNVPPEIRSILLKKGI